MPTTDDQADNRVFLRGKLAGEPVLRDLPSGDQLWVFRLTVDRPGDGRVRVDSIDCVTSTARVRRCLERASPGDEIELDGRLQRRFWRSPNGPASRYEVVATSARLNRRRRNDASPDRTRASA